MKLMPPENQMEPAAGVFLIAGGGLVDPNFARAVVLICEHNEEGSFGLVLNQPLPVKVSDGVEDLKDWGEVEKKEYGFDRKAIIYNLIPKRSLRKVTKKAGGEENATTPS